MKYTTAFDDRRLMILNTTTNQKQAAATEGCMEGKCAEQEVGMKCNSIVSGALEVDEEVKTKINVLSLVSICSHPFKETTLTLLNSPSANPSCRVSQGWGSSKHKSHAARPATSSTMIVLLKFWTCPYLIYLPTLPISGQSICTFTWTVDVFMVAIK